MENLEQRRDALILQRDRLSRVNRVSTSNILDGINERLASVEDEIEQRNKKLVAAKVKAQIQHKQNRNTSQDTNENKPQPGASVLISDKVDHTFDFCSEIDKEENTPTPSAPLLIDIGQQYTTSQQKKQVISIKSTIDPIQEPYINRETGFDHNQRSYQPFVSNITSSPDNESNISSSISPTELPVQHVQEIEIKNADKVESSTFDKRNDKDGHSSLMVPPRRLSQSHLTSDERKEYALQQFEIGRESEDMGHLVAASESYRLALAWCPMMAEAAYNLAMVLTDLGKREEALVEYGKVITISQVSKASEDTIEEGVCLSARTYYNIGLILDEGGNLNGALEQYKKAVEMAPEWVAARHNLAVVQQEIRSGESRKDEIVPQTIVNIEQSITPLDSCSGGSDDENEPDLVNSNASEEEVNCFETAASIMSQSDSKDSSEDDKAFDDDSIATGSSDSDDVYSSHRRISAHHHVPIIEHPIYKSSPHELDDGISIISESDSESDEEQHYPPLHDTSSTNNSIGRSSPHLESAPRGMHTSVTSHRGSHVPSARRRNSEKSIQRRRSSVRLPGETEAEYKERRCSEARQEREMRPPPEVAHNPNPSPYRIGGNLAKQTRTVNLRERQRISSLPKILKERDERRLSALHMANSHVVGLPVAAVHETDQHATSRHPRFGSTPTTSATMVDHHRRHSMPLAPVSTIEMPYYATQQPVPRIGVRDSCHVS